MGISQIEMLNLILVIIIAVVLLLAVIAVMIILRIRIKEHEKKSNTDTIISSKKSEDITKKANIISRTGKDLNSIYQFMEFDSITDNMIVRKNNEQYVMVIECQGINYDLLSQDEKMAVELGFIEFLNTLRYPIQLYVQTRKLDFTDLLKKYSKKTNEMYLDIERLDTQIKNASMRKNEKLIAELILERRRKQNILEYGESIEEYTAKINESKTMLQQRTYICISYFTSELGDYKKYSFEELNDIVFSELYTRAQSVINALTSAEISGRVINSEELAELLYFAYNREMAQTYSLNTALEAEYDRLYSTAKDVLEERKQEIVDRINEESEKLAASSIMKANSILRNERARRSEQVKKQAKDLVKNYKEDMTAQLYNKTIEEIDNSKLNFDVDDEPRIRRIAGRK